MHIITIKIIISIYIINIIIILINIVTIPVNILFFKVKLLIIIIILITIILLYPIFTVTRLQLSTRMQANKHTDQLTHTHT